MVSQKNMKKLIKDGGKSAAFSPAGKAIARRVMAVPEGLALRKLLRAQGLEDHIRRIASESLPEGLYYAKLTIRQWQAYQGKPFRLIMGTDVVYGNEIEPPANGYPLEYRNIIVSSRNAADFRLDIDTPYKLAISRGSFTTPQQAEYDIKYKVIQHGNVFYSLRGNRINPKKILITFPGFGPSTSRVSYAVSNIKDITEEDLRDTLMVCFQDRYLAAGSYMMIDNSGRPLLKRVYQAIESLRLRYQIDQAHIMLFGASKGGSIALHYARCFPEAHLLLAVPQMDLPYYFNKPFFKDNLFANRLLRNIEQPKDLLQGYFDEGRRIDYFYTNNDELSNQSVIEFANDVPNLTKYRVDGPHAAVARAALPAMLGIMRRFLKTPVQGTFVCEEVRTFSHGDEQQVQVRVDEDASKISDANWFLEGRLGRTRFMQIMSGHSYDFVKFTNANQQVFSNYDLLNKISAVTALEASGMQWTCELKSPIYRSANQDSLASVKSLPLSLEAVGVRDYAIIDNKDYGRFIYWSQRLAPTGNAVEVHFVSEVGLPSDNYPRVRGDHEASHIIVIQSLDGGFLADLMALRIVIRAGVDRLVIVAGEGSMTKKAFATLASLDWSDTQVIISGSDSEFSDGARSLHSLGKSQRVMSSENWAV